MDNSSVVLLRVSSDIQDNEVQRQQCLEYCENNDLEVLKVLESKQSAFKNLLTDMQNLQEILTLARQGLIKNVVAWKLDRLGRQMEFISFFTQLDEYGVTIHSVTEGIIKGSSTIEKLMLILRLFQGEQEAENTSIRVKSTIKTMNEQQYVDENGDIIEAFIAGGVPYGCKIIDTGIIRNPKKGTTLKKVVLDEFEAEIVRKIYDMYLYEDKGTTKIAQWLNEHNIPSQRNAQWLASTVMRMLLNPTYTGRLRYNVIEYQSPKSKKRVRLDESQHKYKVMEHLRIVSDEEFERAKVLSHERTTKRNGGTVRGSDNVLLNNICYCGYCGSKLGVSSSKKKNKSRGDYYLYYYICREGVFNHSEGHEQVSWSAPRIEEYVEQNLIKVIRERVMDRDLLDIDFKKHNDKIMKQAKSELARLEKELSEKEAELETLEFEVAKSLTGKSDFTPKMLSKLIAGTESAIGELKSNLLTKRSEVKLIESNVNTSLERLETFLSFDTLYANATTLNEKKQLLRTIVRRIELSKGSIDIQVNLHE